MVAWSMAAPFLVQHAVNDRRISWLATLFRQITTVCERGVISFCAERATESEMRACEEELLCGTLASRGIPSWRR